jgi:hypothetical protein
LAQPRTRDTSGSDTLPNYIPAVLSQYLSLTDSQITSFDQAIGASQGQRVSITMAILGLQTQLSKAVAASTPDPAQIGKLYLQIASQQTALANVTTQLNSELNATLSFDQQAKVKALQDAQSLQPTICAAQTVGLLSSTAPGAGFVLPTPPGILLSAYSFTMSCAMVSVPTATMRNGNFSPAP